ncbi:carbohydrate-binding module family 48 protein [Gelatoporia subvermispora B]|uniref:Carbohydrate-binding module family 48 protein n=1 Tax=Ceriporiopsis subvermispora (strain B) TaxID=914234 RepID=M2R5F6_CERS8|nr:carbohydrate-binding module family 48 protein [Gelatoporia subvermispora B]
MGNSASNPTHSPRHDSPSRRGSPAPAQRDSSAHRVHRSLRQKKKSLELPDLASLTLTPANLSPQSGSPHSAYRRPRASSPIPIPTSPNPPQQVFRPQNNLPSAAHVGFSATDLPAQPRRGRYRDRSGLSSVYPSTRSFYSRGHGSPPPEVPEEPPVQQEFVPEVVNSTLPLALVKAEEDIGRLEPVSVKILWRGGGTNVVLARAGDNSWQGRQPMDFDPQTNTWSTYVSLMPGTHHLKFIVDDQWKTADDYPTAVDDRDGSLANYVAVPFPHSTSGAPIASTSVSPLSTPSPQTAQTQAFGSFWSEGAQGEGDAQGGGWTQVIPQELVAAAAEEEVFLANADTQSTSSSGVPAPNIPPAPVLPRHLDKLILNVRPSAVTGSASMAGVGAAERERSRRSGKDRSKRDRESRARASLGMTSSNTANVTNEAGDHLASPQLTLPIATASGTDVTANVLSSPPTTPMPSTPQEPSRMPVAKLDGPGLADDASVLPVPSHVVLHHLSTSAIRNGVLAVANTTRYKKKYITTIYYKPT